MSDRTITVAGHFGDKQVTKGEFVVQWVDHMNQARRISYATGWQKQMDGIITSVRAQARMEFERLYKQEQS